jgi:hypothetical protein
VNSSRSCRSLPPRPNVEWLLVVSPDLADVLSAIIQRVREPSGAVPLVPAYDWHECVSMPPAPLLFQRRFRTENRSINHGTLRKMLQAALADTGLVDAADGAPQNYTRLHASVHHRRHHERAAAPHRPDHRRSPGHQRHARYWPDPAQRARIVEIRDNLIARIAEADREGWLGEVEGLDIASPAPTTNSPSSTAAHAHHHRRPRHAIPSALTANQDQDPLAQRIRRSVLLAD